MGILVEVVEKVKEVVEVVRKAKEVVARERVK